MARRGQAGLGTARRGEAWEQLEVAVELGKRQKMINLAPIDEVAAPAEPVRTDDWIEANSDSLESILETLDIPDPAPNLARAALARVPSGS